MLHLAIVAVTDPEYYFPAGWAGRSPAMLHSPSIWRPAECVTRKKDPHSL